MALMITDECINCDVCEPECPNGAITQGDEIYVIDPSFVHRVRRALRRTAVHQVCPVDCIITNPEHMESKEELQAKYEKLQAKG